MSKHPLIDALERMDMRAGADWQLEQVLEWLRTTQVYHCPSVMADLLEEAMRPTQENNS